MARCLVTGHHGYIGSKLFKKLQDLDHEVMGIDLKSENREGIEDVLRADSNGLFSKKFEDFQPEYIFHMACWPRVGLCLDKPVETMLNNVLGGSIVLNFANKIKSVKRVIYSSSSSVVGNGDGPSSPYGLQKYVTELETKIYAEVYGLETVSLRYFNVYSEDQTIEGPYATAVANWMRCLREDAKPFITGDGEQRRDMIHVDDVVSANVFAMEYKGKFGGKHYDVGTGTNISLNEIKEIIQKHHDIDFDYIEPRPGDVMLSRAEIKPLKEIGWQHSIAIKEGITRCFKRRFK